MILLTMRLFGELSAVDYRGDALSIGNRRIQALVVYLALKGAGHTSIREMAELLFGDPSAESDVRALIRDLRYALRYLPHDIVLDSGSTVHFNPSAVAVDARQFEQMIGSPSVNSIRRAAEIYRGDLLENFSTGLTEFDRWLEERRLKFRRSALAIFGNLLSAQIRAGWWEEAVETARRLLAVDPSQEVVHRTLMRLHLDQGRPEWALRRYEECAEILRRDYGREPEQETERLKREIAAAVERSGRSHGVMPERADRPVLALVVEDDLVSAALVESYLAEAGCECVTVSDGGAALIELGRSRFDLLILDVNIPTLDGLKIFEIMLQKQIETPAVFISGVAGIEIETQSLEMGAAGFIRKPVRKEVLLPKIRGILNRSRRARAAEAGRD